MTAEQGSPRLYLASRSPRRAELLRQLGLVFTPLECEYEEVLDASLPAPALARQLAEGKALSGWQAPGRERSLPVLAADTLIELDGQVLGKPRDEEHALAMLRTLAGREHQAHTGVAVVLERRCESLVSSTRVQFAELSDRQMRAYWRTGEPADKAGAYAIQGLGAMFVAAVHGSYSSVVGLPLFETVQLLARFGVCPLADN